MKVLIDVVVLLIIGFIIGDERQKEGKVIGVRTTTLVLLGSFIFSYIAVLIGDAPRMITGVAGAIGFIGSGIVWKGEGMTIGNLTTAVLILVLAGIGCLLALSYIVEATAFSIVTMLVLHFYKKVGH